MLRIARTKASEMLSEILAPPKHTASSVGRYVKRRGQAISYYAAGICRPPLDVRAQLEELLGIPRTFWDEPAEAIAEAVPSVASDAPAPTKTRPRPKQRAA